MSASLQERYAPASICYGCGPANVQGLHVRSFVEGDVVVADWTPSAHHEAFPGMVNGGIIGSILDCHCNWAAAWHLMQQRDLDAAAVHRDRHLHDRHEAPDAERTALCTSSHGSSTPTDDRCTVEAHARGGRASHRDVPRRVRRGEAGSPRVSPLVIGGEVGPVFRRRPYQSPVNAER